MVKCGVEITRIDYRAACAGRIEPSDVMSCSQTAVEPGHGATICVAKMVSDVLGLLPTSTFIETALKMSPA